MNLRKLQIKNNDRSTQTFIFKNDISLFEFINHHKNKIFNGSITYKDIQYPTHSINTILIKDINFENIDVNAESNVDCSEILPLEETYGKLNNCSNTSCNKCILSNAKELLIINELVKQYEHTKITITK